jgi:hypothetical protein
MRAFQQPPPQPDIDDHDALVVVELHAGDPGADEVEQLVEYSGQAHDLEPFEPEPWNSPEIMAQVVRTPETPGWPHPTARISYPARELRQVHRLSGPTTSAGEAVLKYPESGAVRVS